MNYMLNVDAVMMVSGGSIPPLVPESRRSNGLAGFDPRTAFSNIGFMAAERIIRRNDHGFRIPASTGRWLISLTAAANIYSIGSLRP